MIVFLTRMRYNRLDPVVFESFVLDDPECIHHDIICYYESITEEYTVRVVIDGDEPPFIEIKLSRSDEDVVIKDGCWYFA